MHVHPWYRTYLYKRSYAVLRYRCRCDEKYGIGWGEGLFWRKITPTHLSNNVVALISKKIDDVKLTRRRRERCVSACRRSSSDVYFCKITIIVQNREGGSCGGRGWWWWCCSFDKVHWGLIVESSSMPCSNAGSAEFSCSPLIVPDKAKEVWA